MSPIQRHHTILVVVQKLFNFFDLIGPKTSGLDLGKKSSEESLYLSYAVTRFQIGFIEKKCEKYAWQLHKMAYPALRNPRGSVSKSCS